MDRLHKIIHLIKIGYTYDSESGEIKSRFGNILTSKNQDNYLVIYFSVNKKKYMLRAHHFAWYHFYKEIVYEIDHKNNIRIDNRICNLRSVTRSQNQHNKPRVKGCTFSKSKKKWIAQICINNKRKYIGSFSTEIEASKAYWMFKEINVIFD
jgi:hypothetical protein